MTCIQDHARARNDDISRNAWKHAWKLLHGSPDEIDEIEVTIEVRA